MKILVVDHILMMIQLSKCFLVHVVAAVFVICLSPVSIADSSTSGSSRTKRLIWGKPLTDPKSYAVTSYVALLTGGGIFSYLHAKAKELLTGELPKPTERSITCGGALITKTVVQTACHCTSHLLKVNASYSQAKALTGWEHWSTIFVGFLLLYDMRQDGLWAKKYIVHQKCAFLLQNFALSVTHDYALVVMNKEVNFRLLHQSVAPVYTELSISKIYYQILKQEAVCLYAGFGAYYFKKPGISNAGSPVMQHGWRVIRPYWYCYWRTYLDSFRHYYSEFGLSYPQVATWICTQYFGKERGTPWAGDSGSPVTCNNVYVGLVSFKSVIHLDTNVSTDFFGSLAFSQYENAANYRKSLIAKISDYAAFKEWPPNKPVFIEARNDWGLYFEANSTNGSIWIMKRFSEKGALETKIDSSVTASKSISISKGGWIAYIISLMLIHRYLPTLDRT